MPYIICLIAFIISSVAMPPLISLAHSNGVVALPGKRHIHTHPTPKFGGIAIALTVLLLSPFAYSFDRIVGAYMLSSALMLLLGIIDDVKGTGWKIKLIFSLSATSIVMFSTGLWFENLGNLFGFGDVHLGLWGIPFTFFAVFGIVNAINLIDGLNGLAAGVSAIALLAFAVFAYFSGNNTVLYISLANLGATLGFFRYNYPKARIFMGDAGSMFLGYSLAFLSIILTQGQSDIGAMVPVIVLGVPMFDTVRVLVIRVKNRRHPFAADKTHLHHLMMRSGIPQRRVVKTIWLLSILMSLIAFVLYKYEAWLMLLLFCSIMTVIGIFIENLPIIKSTSVRLRVSDQPLINSKTYIATKK